MQQRAVIQTDKISARFDLEVSVGFSGSFVVGTWTPVHVSVLNNGRNTAAELQIRVPNAVALSNALSGDLGAATYSRSVSLPNGTRKRFEFTVFIQSITTPLLVRLLTPGAEQALAQIEIDLRHHQTGRSLLLVAGADADLDYLNDEIGGVRVRYLHPQRLPEHWQAYEGAAGLVLHGVSLEHLNEAQFQALYRWIAQGGALIVAADANYSLLQTDRLRAILPAVPTGTFRIRDPVASLKAVFGDAPISASPFFIHRLEGLVEGQILLELQGHPLVTQRGLGLGRVVYLGFDIGAQPFSAWTGLKASWNSWLALNRDEAVWLNSQADQLGSGLKSLIQSGWFGFPDHPTLLLFLLLYLTTLMLLPTLMGKPDSTKVNQPAATWRRIGPLLVAAVFTVVGHALFGSWLFARGAGAVVLSSIRPLGELEFAKVEVDLGLFWTSKPLSVPSLQGMSPLFRTETDSVRADDIGYRPINDIVIGVGAKQYVMTPNPVTYSLLAAHGKDVIPFALRASLQQLHSGRQLLVDNFTGGSLIEPVLIVNDTLYSIASLQHGVRYALPVDAMAVETQSSSIMKLERDLARRYVNRMPEQQRDAARHVIEQALASVRSQSSAHEAYAILLAQTASPLRFNPPAAAQQRVELSILIMRLPVPVIAVNETAIDDSF